ncbi:hypothetical protein KHA80_14515 [Anaerobacillus sp. HL2]|nr:hypothetical protein KHA80_14515 [Anaerobacillus sp. HL2]
MVDANVDFYLLQIQQSLIDKTFTTSPYEVNTIHDSGKEREIHKLPYFPDRIVQWAVMLQIEDFLIKSFILDTYAAIPKRGMHLALKRVPSSFKASRGNTVLFEV